MTNRTGALRSNDSTPLWHLVVAGIKRGAGPLVVEQPMTDARRLRIELAVAHSLTAAALADEAGDPDYAAGFRADAARMHAALAS